MQFDSFLSLLKNVRKTGTYRWLAACPAHDDTSQNSLSVKMIDSKITLKCKKGCPQPSILKALDLTITSLLDEDDYKSSLGSCDDIDYDELRQVLVESSNYQYTIQNSAFCRVITPKDKNADTYELPLCNFVARITGDIYKDSGAAVHRFLKLQGRLNGVNLPEITVPEDRFDGMTWVRREWGTKVQIEKAIDKVERHISQAIVKSSGRVPEHTIYTHTGWRRINDRMTYLTNGGAIGIPDIEVELTPQLARYNLPQPDGDPKDAIEKSLDIVLIADPSVTLPTFILPYLSVLNVFEEIPFTAFFTGHSGAFKSVLEGLALSHFGHFTHKTLPASWYGTKTELEKLAFYAKDILFCIDDYAPPSDSREARELNNTVGYILRAYGNRQGKVRSNVDLTSQETFPPRGFLVTSGEHLPPAGVSRSARTLPIPVKRESFESGGDGDYYMLTKAQKEAALYPVAMAHFIKWLIENWEIVERDFRSIFDDYRIKSAGSQAHLRLTESISLMQAAYSITTQFACDKKAIKESSRDRMLAESWEILTGLLRQQNRRIITEEPAVKFIDVLQSLLASGRVAFRTRNSMQEWIPEQPPPGQALIGWDDGGDILYLNRDEAYAAVFLHCQRIGEYFGTHADETWQDMKRLGYLARFEKDTPTIQKKITNRNTRVLAVFRKIIYPEEVNEPQE